jgi:hypothetical protein
MMRPDEGHVLSVADTHRKGGSDDEVNAVEENAMQLILTETDFAAMPAALREDLISYLTTLRNAAPSGIAKRERTDAVSTNRESFAILDRAQVVALVRDVSFGHQLKGLHDLLAELSYEKEADAPGPERLGRLLKIDDPRRLRRYFDAIKRLLKQVTGDTAPLARYSPHTRTYMVHPLTRQSLREVFAQLERSGEDEEPPWA